MIDQDRYSRLLAIPDYPAEKVIQSLVLVGGVGALGNELVKNLCLLGFRRILLVDLDLVEPSNLTRSVLFRPEDCGKPKVMAAAENARHINHETTFYTHHGDIANLGLGVLRRTDLIFSDFDDLYPRFVINSSAVSLGKLWIDAYLGLKPYGGGVTVFNATDPDAPCYVCHAGLRTFKETYNFIQDREGCQVRERERSKQGFLPTTPTTCSIVAGLQTQAGLHYLVKGAGSDNPWVSKMFHIDIANLKSHQEKPILRKKCPFHPPVDGVDSKRFREYPNWFSDKTTLKQAFQQVREDFGISDRSKLYLQPHRQIVVLEQCTQCRSEIEVFKPVTDVIRDSRKGVIRSCPGCGSTELRYHPLMGLVSLFDETDFPFMDYTLSKLGIRSLDILTFLEDNDFDQKYYFAEITGDVDQILPGLEI